MIFNKIDILRIFARLTELINACKYANYLSMRDICFRDVGRMPLGLRNDLAGFQGHMMFPKVGNKISERLLGVYLFFAGNCEELVSFEQLLVGLY